MAQSQPLSAIVNVTTQIESGGVLFRDFGIGLFITSDDTLGTGDNRIIVAQNFDAVAQVFSNTSEAYKAANAWFAQSPTPKNLIIGRWYNEDHAAAVLGGELTLTPSGFAALTNTTSISIEVNGVEYTASNVDLSAVTTYADVATAIQSALVGQGAPVNVVYIPERKALLIASSTEGASSTIAPATGTLAVQAKLDEDNAQEVRQGVDQETLITAFEEIKAINDSATLIMLDNAVMDADKITFAKMIEAEKNYLFSAQSDDADILLSSDTASIAHELYNEQLSYTFLTYSSTLDYKAVSIAARFSSINFSAPNSLITGMFKVLPTLDPDSFNAQQIQVMKSKNVNFYTLYATQPIYNDGRCFANGVWIDAIYALLWFQNNVQVRVFDLLVQTPKVPQTDGGEALIYHAIVDACQQAVTNGMIATGRVTDAMTNDIISTTGNTNFDGTLFNGFLVWSQPSALQAQPDRTARKATAKKVWLKGSGAIHSVDIGVIFEN